MDCLSLAERQYSASAQPCAVSIHLRRQHKPSKSNRVYDTDAPEGHPSRCALSPKERLNRVSSKRKRRLTEKQERQRMEGLRILARIIARHHLAKPHLYPNGSTPTDGQQTDCGEANRKEGKA